MKARTFTLTAMMAFCLVFSAWTTRAQYYDEKPELPLKGEYYSATNLPEVRNTPAAVNPFIANIISGIRADSIRATIQHLQDYGTRFMLADNRRSIAEWLAGKFISYGYTDVKLDSFLNILNWNNVYIDTTWQYNVVCTLAGASAPDEIYIVDGHYDSFCYGDPYTIAPGANDNASAIAATLEIARVIKASGYQPEATIRFSPFAAEELGLFGGRYAAWSDSAANNDIRFVLNMDMISNDPDSGNVLKIYRYYGVEWAGYLAADVFARYTSLDIFLPANLAASGSDSYPYWLYGYPVMYLEEMNFSPNWHQLSDTVGNCNTAYCAEVARGACATLLEQQFLPYPQDFWAWSSPEGVNLSWKPTSNANLLGYNIYRSDSSGSGYVKLNPVPFTESYYQDQTAVAGKEYYYVMNLVNDSLQEGMTSNEMFGTRIAFSDTLLVVASLAGTQTTPDSVRNFYDAVLDSIPYKWVDINQEKKLDLGVLGRCHSMLWVLNNMQYELTDDPLAIRLINYFENGGNVMIAGFRPSNLLAGNDSYPQVFNDHYFISWFFKISGVDREMISMMYQAYPDMAGYDTLRINPQVELLPGHPGELYNIETFTPSQQGSVNFRFDSKYDSTTSFGASQGRAVGVEYMGDDFKTITLSFPLYYLDTTDARKLMKYVMTNKFGSPTGIPDLLPGKNDLSLLVYPNPASGSVNCSYRLDKPARITLDLYDMQGRMVRTISETRAESGIHTVVFDTRNLPSGIYQVVLVADRQVVVQKVVLLR